jgi:hypothetical protein
MLYSAWHDDRHRARRGQAAYIDLCLQKIGIPHG